MGDITTNTWDGENHLQQVEHPDLSITTYLYDAEGHRIQKDDGVDVTRQGGRVRSDQRMTLNWTSIFWDIRSATVPATRRKYAWIRDRSSDQGEIPADSFPHRVAEKLPSKWGLYDMHGNVREYTLDYFGKTHVGGIDPIQKKKSKYRVIRGNSWNVPIPEFDFVWSRMFISEGRKSNSIGFRVVISDKSFHVQSE